MVSDHDPLCPQYDQTEHSIAMFDTPCRCDEYTRVRADERAKVYRPDAHRMMLERDAARAEVAALREEVAHAWAVANGEARR